MIKIFYVNYTDMTEDIFRRWLPYINKDKAERIMRMREKDSKASLTGELLLRYGAKQLFGISPYDIKTENDDMGKPIIISHKGIYFNISHSGDLCACAVGDENVGLDIQQMKAVRHESLAKRSFTEKEYKEYLSLGATADAFFRIWTHKEAVYKLYGDGLSGMADELKPHKIIKELVIDDYRLCAAVFEQ